MSAEQVGKEADPSLNKQSVNKQSAEGPPITEQAISGGGHCEAGRGSSHRPQSRGGRLENDLLTEVTVTTTAFSEPSCFRLLSPGYGATQPSVI